MASFQQACSTASKPYCNAESIYRFRPWFGISSNNITIAIVVADAGTDKIISTAAV